MFGLRGALAVARRVAAAPSGARCMAASTRPDPASADSLLQIGTRGIFDETHDAFRESVRRFYKESIIPNHDKWEEAGVVPRDVWRAAGKLGFLGVTMPEEYGGAGADVLMAAVHWEEQSYSGCSGPGFALHSEIVAPYILHWGTEAQKRKYLPPMCGGDMITAIAMTEPGAGSDLQGVRTTAVRTGDHYVLNGSKTFITNGANADTVIVVAKTDAAAKGSHGISLLLVEAGTPGFEKGKMLKKMGLKAQDTSELFFDNVKVPVGNLLGKENGGFAILMKELPLERLIVADSAAASAEAAFEWTRSYCKERKAFGGKLMDMQVTRHKLAEMKTETVVGRVFADHCLSLFQAGRLDPGTASMAKYWLTDLQNKVVDAGVQLHGGFGYMWEYPICKAYVDARVQKIYAGTNEIMKELISRGIAK